MSSNQILFLETSRHQSGTSVPLLHTELQNCFLPFCNSFRHLVTYPSMQSTNPSNNRPNPPPPPTKKKQQNSQQQAQRSKPPISHTASSRSIRSAGASFCRSFPFPATARSGRSSSDSSSAYRGRLSDRTRSRSTRLLIVAQLSLDAARDRKPAREQAAPPSLPPPSSRSTSSAAAAKWARVWWVWGAPRNEEALFIQQRGRGVPCGRSAARSRKWKVATR